MNLTAEQLMGLFVHRKDVFSTQQKNGAYFPTKRPITVEDIEKHIAGDTTIGVYCLEIDNTVKWACVDLDGDKDKTPAENRRMLYPEANIVFNTFHDFPRMLEFSGRKGFHIWVFFEPRVTADYAQRLVKARLNRVGLNRHEVFPKQTELNESRLYGNLVKLPMAVHKKTGLRSEIIKMEGLELVGSVTP